MLDRAVQITFRQFSTLFLVVALVALPAHLIYSFIYRDVIAVQEIHSQILELDRGRLPLTTVGRGEIEAARRAGWVPTIVELLALPFLIRATRRVLEADMRGDLTGALSAWKGTFGRTPKDGLARDDAAGAATAILIGVAFALLVGFLSERVGLLVASPLGDGLAWVGDGLVHGIARSIGGPFALVPLAMSAWFAKGDKGVKPTPN